MRVRLLRLLRRGSPTVSHHLRVLREAGWVTAERRGTWIWYAIRPEAVARFRDLAGELAAGPARPAALCRVSLGR